MDPETETLAKILNNPLIPSSTTRGFRIRQTKPTYKPPANTRNQKLLPLSQVAKKPLPEDEEMVQEILDFYKEEDEKYRQAATNKTGGSIFSLNNPSQEKSKSVLKLQKFLAFKPYIDPMSIRPNTRFSDYFFRMQNSEVKLIRYTLEDNGFKEAKNGSNWSIMWHGGPLKLTQYQFLCKYQKVNHFPRSHELTRKDLMYKNLAKMQIVHGVRSFNFVPKTFIMPQDAGQLEYEMNLKEGVWIVKPSASSQGKGIFLASKFSDVPKKDHVVSQYIDNPLLIDGLKFDLRIYVAITSFNPLRIYMYKEGLVRFATKKYRSSSKSRFMYLTNYSVNKFSENFIENENALEDDRGSKWSISALRKLFAEQGVNDEKIWAKIKDLVIKSVISVEDLVFSACEMHLPYRDNCFQLLGFDVLIDDLLNPWLLEVNLSPSMNCDAPIDQKIKGELIADLFTLSGVVSIGHRVDRPGCTKNKSMNFLAYMEKKKTKKGKIKMTEFPDRTNKEENSIIKETRQEDKRKGQFERIFPAENAAVYKGLFERQRPFNVILMNNLNKIVINCK